jgi:hypothetical protein
MNKLMLFIMLLIVTPTHALQESICVDKTQVEQSVAALKHIASALAALAQKVEALLHQDQEKIPKRTINFDAWKEFVDHRHEEYNQEENTDKNCDNDDETNNDDV